MPNYDIIPLATDLLDYTIQRVRAKEPEYRHTQVYVMENGQLVARQLKVIRKLRHSSIKRMRAKLRYWEKAYPQGLVTREAILQSWQAWDAHAAHGNTWALRQQIKARVQNILKEDF